MHFLPALPPFFALIFSLFPLYVWWVKLFDHLRPVAAFSFFSIAAGFVLPTVPWIAFVFGVAALFFPGKPVDHPHIAMRFKNRWIKFPLEAFSIWLVYTFFKLLPLKIASNLGIRLGRYIGTKLKKRTKLALDNMALVFPNNTQDHPKMVERMWENFGRTITELPHIKTLSKRTKIEGLEHLEALKGKPYLVALAHLSNLSVIAKPFGLLNQNIALFLRTANNPLTTPFLQKVFGGEIAPLSFLSKGREGTMKAVKALSQNTPVAIATDLHIKGGDKLTFLGKPAITSSVLTKLADKFNCPIVAIRVTREKNFKHTVHICKPMHNAKMQDVNDEIGRWVKENPEQWFWVSNRWHQG